jgi:hypothetical protein
MGSIRFRRRIGGPHFHLNINTRSVGLSVGLRGLRFSRNTDGQSTTSVGIPGSGLQYRDQHGPRRRHVVTRVDGVDVDSPLGTALAIVGLAAVAVIVVAAALLVWG